MRKSIILSFIIGAITLLGFQTALADTLYRAEIGEVISRKNVTISQPETGENYLLYLGKGCGDLEAGQKVNLSIHGKLDYRKDFIKLSALHGCQIEQAEQINSKLYIEKALGKNQAYVLDENGVRFYITYNYCKYFTRYKRDYIYIRKWGSNLSSGDRIYLPNKDGICSIKYVQEIPEKLPKKLKKENDIKVPTIVNRVKASPGNTKVYLSWKAAKDNVGISHYIVSYSPYRLRSKTIPLNEMPNQIQTKSTYIAMEGLRNNEKYFFYVLAVDVNGNKSSRWSRVKVSTPRATILPR